MIEEVKQCPECGSQRSEPSRVCPACGAPPLRDDEHRGREEEVRTEDLEPYVTLRYIARMFKVLAVLIAVMLVGEIVTGLVVARGAAIMTLLGEVTRLLVLAGLAWGGGDVMLLLIDAGHDVRVSRILLGRINAVLHHGGGAEKPVNGERKAG